MAVNPTEANATAGTKGDDGVINTQEEAVQSWLAQPGNKNVDFENLTLEELKSLIAYLETFKNQPWAKSQDFKELVSDLKELGKNWTQANASGDDLAIMKAKLDGQLGLLNALESIVPRDQRGEIIEAKKDVTEQLYAVNDLMLSLAENDEQWNAQANGETTVLRTNEQIQKIENLEKILENQGVENPALTDSLGLLKGDLQAALTVYNEAMSQANGSDNPELQKKIALSEFRENTAKAKLAYYDSIGLSNKDPLYIAEQNTIAREDIWQNALKTEWSAENVPKPTDTSKEGLEDYLETLKMEREAILAQGGTEEDVKLALLYIDKKIEVTATAVNALSDPGNSDTVDEAGVFFKFYESMQAVEIAQLDAGIAKANDAASKNGISADEKKKFIDLAADLEAKKEVIQTKLDAVMGVLKDVYRQIAEFADYAIRVGGGS